MKFNKLVQNIINEEENIEFYYPSKDEEKKRDIYFANKNFEEWFSKNKDRLEEIEIIDEETGKKIIAYNSNYNIDISYLNLFKIFIQFNIVNGYFSCNNNNLISLKGCPKIIYGNFDCFNNQLESLKYCPKIVYGSFNCSYNQLKLLKDCSKIINGYFNCSHNQLESLEGCPEIINDDFDCSYNQLKTLKGCPKIINGSFNCVYNQLTSLEGCPKEVYGDFYCYNNKVKFTKEEIRSKCYVKGNIWI